jgi:hypothetical protein
MTLLNHNMTYILELEEQQLVIRWRNVNELKDKLHAVLDDLESATGQRAFANSPPLQSHSESIPPEVRKLGLNTFSAAMLAVIREEHRGRPNATDAKTLAQEMKQRYPLLFAKKDPGEVAHGTIFPGKKMAESGLIKMEKIPDPTIPGHQYRVYWSD